MALVERAGWDVAVGARVASIASGAALFALTLRHAARRFELGPLEMLVTALFLATLPAMGLWSTSGLETMPTALLVFLVYERLLCAARPRTVGASLAAGLLVLIRADGAVWLGLALAGAAGVAVLERRGELWRAILFAGGAAALVVVAHTAWRFSYYGDWLPNTARVKAGFSTARLVRGAQYAATFLLMPPSIALVLGLGLLRWKPGTRDVRIPCAVVIGGSLGYSIWVGGDFMPFGRFLFNAVPFLVLVFAALWRGPLGTRGTLAAGASAIALSVLAALDVHPLGSVVREHLHFRQDRDEWQTEVARWREMKENTARWKLWGRAMALHTKLGESIICGAAGAQNYFCELRAYDTYGLVTPEVVEHRRKHPKKGAASPGHDLGVHEGFFFPPEHGGKLSVRPTYLGGFLWADPKVYPQRPWWAGALPKGWSEHAWSRLVDIERYPLRAEDGFPQGSELRMLRFHWD